MTDDGQAPALERAELDDLLRELLGRVQGAVDERERLRLLLDAVMAMQGDLSLDGVLARIVRITARIVGVRYVALGVLAQGPGKRLHTFVHHGLSEEQAAAIGRLPEGHGLLGQIIDHAEPLRLRDIAGHPASAGFPPHHPSMRSLLGVPVRARGRVFGNLYLSEKRDGLDFTARDEEIALALAAGAGVAVENARLYEGARRRESWATATTEVVQLIGRLGLDAEAREVVARRAREMARADEAVLVMRDRACAGSPEARALATGETVRDAAAGVVAAPLRSSTGTVGALVLRWRHDRAEHLHALDLSLPAGFAEQVALALEAAEGRRDRERLAVLEDRDRIGRDLHDLVIQRLFAVSLSLDNAARRSEDERVAARVSRAVDDLDQTIKDVRRTIFALAAPEGAADIQSQVTQTVERAGATLKFRPTLRFAGPVRTLVDDELAPDLIAVLGEALSNASRHAGAGAVQVELSAGEPAGGGVRLVVTDDGRGLPEQVAESGLANMRDRAQRRGGTFLIDSAPGRGTRVVWAVPAPGGAG